MTLLTPFWMSMLLYKGVFFVIKIKRELMEFPLRFSWKLRVSPFSLLLSSYLEKLSHVVAIHALILRGFSPKVARSSTLLSFNPFLVLFYIVVVVSFCFILSVSNHIWSLNIIFFVFCFMFHPLIKPLYPFFGSLIWKYFLSKHGYDLDAWMILCSCSSFKFLFLS